MTRERPGLVAAAVAFDARRRKEHAMRFPFVPAALAAVAAFAFVACKTDPATIPDATSDSLAGDVLTDTTVDTADGEDSAEVAPDSVQDATTDSTPDSVHDSGADSADDSDGADDTDDTSAEVADDADASPDVSDGDTSAADADTSLASCGAAEDCQNCTWGLPVASVSDCYCPICPSYPLSRTECAKNQADWETHCTSWAETNPCPVPRCLVTAAPICDEGACIANPNACFEGSECGTCRFPQAPKSPSDCACPTCPAPTAITHCEAIESAVAQHCAAFDFESCPLPNCPRPPAIGCTNERICGYGDLLPEER